MGYVAHFQHIDIYAKVDPIGEETNDFAAYFAPGAALVEGAEKSPDFINLQAGILKAGVFDFGSIPVAHTYGQQAANACLLRGMIQHGCMRIPEPLIGRPQICVRI